MQECPRRLRALCALCLACRLLPLPLRQRDLRQIHRSRASSHRRPNSSLPSWSDDSAPMSVAEDRRLKMLCGECYCLQAAGPHVRCPSVPQPHTHNPRCRGRFPREVEPQGRFVASPCADTVLPGGETDGGDWHASGTQLGTTGFFSRVAARPGSQEPQRCSRCRRVSTHA